MATTPLITDANVFFAGATKPLKLHDVSGNSRICVCTKKPANGKSVKYLIKVQTDQTADPIFNDVYRHIQIIKWLKSTKNPENNQYSKHFMELVGFFPCNIDKQATLIYPPTFDATTVHEPLK